MQLSHTLLIPLALGLSWAGHMLCWSHESLRPAPTPAALGIAGSPYGSLVARLMRDSLFSYWHGGQTAEAHEREHQHGGHHEEHEDEHQEGHKHDPEDDHDENPSLSWLDRAGGELNHLEAARTRRNSPFAMTPAHRRYLDSSATWRLRFAYGLDPGDATLYEILHFQLASHPEALEKARQATTSLANEAIRHALSNHGGMSDALTGAGAAINLLNEQLLPGQTRRDPAIVILGHWDVLNRCLQRYRDLRKQADAEGWWQGIPEPRQEELATHAHLLEKITATIRQQLVNEKFLSS